MCKELFDLFTKRLVVVAGLFLLGGTCEAGLFTGEIVDARTGEPLAARVYVQSEQGEWIYVNSAFRKGSAIPYKEEWVPMPNSVERHTTVSAHPFQAELDPGRYTFTIERGKEYHTLTRTIEIGSSARREFFYIRRWVNAASQGWYSGETHVHRRISELSNVMLAEDLNVAFPVTFWTTQAYEAPHLRPSTLRRQGPSPFGDREDLGAEMIQIDPTHVVYPRNTEYEIFSVGEKRHVLGAVFVLNHKSKFVEGMPPVKAIAEQAHREGALLDLDKHTWPWSMMVAPIAKVDLYELSNNSVWRTEFGFRQPGIYIPEYMKISRGPNNELNEAGWLDFGFQNYYALLNCGFRMTPTAGTASGVHPVPLGYSRVYVRLEGEFSGEAFLAGLKAGRSFVTNGPMLFATVNGRDAGSDFDFKTGESGALAVSIESRSEKPVSRIEVLLNGKVIEAIVPTNEFTLEGAYLTRATTNVPVSRTGWIAIRSFEPQSDGRERFAHTAPWHFQFGGESIRPRSEEVKYLIRNVQEQITRNQGVLGKESLDEFRESLSIYKKISERAL